MGTAGKIRIIGGRWRGRRISVRLAPQLRPTPNRLRETLFNWLQTTLAGAACLDLFAGTGMLGFESVSRGARRAVLVEKEARVYAKLQAQKTCFDAREVRLVHADALLWMAGQAGRDAGPFDVVFLDPPFHNGLVAKSCALLRDCGLLSKTGVVYVESEPELAAPLGWRVHKQARGGHVRGRLIRPD